MKKTIFVVNIGDYMPEVFGLTFPTVKNYAKKIGAEVHVISERKHIGVSPTYEKTQIFELGMGNDWNILVDADIAISHRLPDVTSVVPETHVGVHMSYVASPHFPCDQYFWRDGRNVAISSDFMAVPKACHDVWTPLDGDPSTYNIKRPFILDEYCFSRNLARYGLKFGGLISDESMIFHLNQATEGDKTVDELRSYVTANCQEEL